MKADEERGQLLRQVVKAQEDERRRIALEMHDEFGQQLSALVLKLSALKRGCGRRANLSQQLASSEAIARQLDRDLEQIVWRLRPTTLDDLGLTAALTHYVKRWSDHFGIHAEFHANSLESDRLTGEIDTALYRITQEALNNVAKHARADNVAILLDGRLDRVSMIIEDDGIGFDLVSVTPRRRLGIVGMRERATLLGGTVEIESHPGRGTTVVARIPVPSGSGQKQM
jgi:signal transduction histidine kinase